MAALSGEKTLAELAAEFGVHPTMISDWKQELVKRAGEPVRATTAGGDQVLPQTRSAAESPAATKRTPLPPGSPTPARIER